MSNKQVTGKLDDTISRQDAIDVLDVLCQEHRYKIPGKRETYSQYNEAWQDALDRAERAIFNLPSVQTDRKTGKWVEHHEPFTWMGYTYWTCSECNFGEKEENKTRSNFCPHCGAEMVENSGG